MQLNWLKKELIPPLKSTIVIDVNQINNCIEYEAEFSWISPKPWYHRPNANRADRSVGARNESNESEVSQSSMFDVLF